MRCRNAKLLTLAVLLTAIAAPTIRAQETADLDKDAVQYRVFQLGTLGGTSSSGNTINNIGWAMGSANLRGDSTEHATVWIYGLEFDLKTLGGPNSDVSWPIKNDHGLVAGWSETAALDPLGESWSCTAFTPTPVPTGHTCVGFSWKWGAMTALPTLGGSNGFAAGANDRGQIAGWAENKVHDRTCVTPQVLQFKPVVYGPGKAEIRELPTYPEDPDGAATAINREGEVVGISGTCDVAVGAFSAKHALLWKDGKVIDLGNLGGKGWNTPMAINNRGDIVGFSDLKGDVVDGQLSPNFQAFIWTRETGRMTNIGTLPGDSLSEALDINDRRQVVGVSFPSTHAFLWEDGKMTDLNSLIPYDSSLVLLAAGGISEKGEITGQACVIADGGCPAGKYTPAFLALPRRERDEHDGGWSNAQTGSAAAMVVVPESVRQQVMRRWTFGHPEPEQER